MTTLQELYPEEYKPEERTRKRNPCKKKEAW